MPPDRLTIHVRVPPLLLKQLKLAAVENDRSMNAEISARLERSFSIDDADRAEALKLLNEVISILDKGSA
ncbi:Arc family DNA-binding protein [Mesorhizobium sp. B2-5-11]|uniref:Arc family DNA-binding protein n=1 Tax=Mesorhizobium sp. B2-5-11 TaxID=2589919 RepID=UPI001129E275|nr:Arc family DNA-binding protein [Mesorhizobium sp. B2-5-11]TPK14138.1 Arc family DNA-binding protein [Mesorhizobium sp. B2-5-11]